MRRHAAFMQWLAFTVALAIAVFFAGYFGLLSLIWTADLSYVTTCIALLTVATIAYSGILSWQVPDGEWFHGLHEHMRRLEDARDWIETARDISAAMGIIGTVYGLYKSFSLRESASNIIDVIGTGSFCTLAGSSGYAIITFFSQLYSSSLKRVRRNA